MCNRNFVMHKRSGIQKLILFSILLNIIGGKNVILKHNKGVLVVIPIPEPVKQSSMLKMLNCLHISFIILLRGIPYIFLVPGFKQRNKPIC